MSIDFTRQERVAYFTMEIALRDEISTFAGGLGVLAGDTMRSAVDLDIPFVAVSLASRKGYFCQEIDGAGRQIEKEDPWDVAKWTTPTEARVTVRIEGRNVWVQGWLYVLEGKLGGRQPVVFLDTALPENTPEDRAITDYLYGDDRAYRLKQEIVLGIGGVRLLHALGYRIRQYHLNEGHSALLGLELLRRNGYPAEDVRPGEPLYDVPLVRETCNFTTHTPVEAGHDKFPYDLVERVLGDFIEARTLKTLAGDDVLNMTRLAMNLSECINGVATSHARTSAILYPGYHVHAITNGVHPYTWTAPGFASLYDEYVRGWCHQPELLVRADQIPDERLWQAHLSAKETLLETIEERTGARLDRALPLVGFARRMTGYKRPDLLFSDLERLKRIARKLPFQVVLSGKAHPQDEEGKRLIEQLHAHMRSVAGVLPTVYVPEYTLGLASQLVSGVDVWLNTPLPPFEASGTSGMKAAFNGVPSLSVLDGWWVEGCVEGVTGWAVGDGAGSSDDATSLYRKLEDVVLPLYTRDRAGWMAVMRGAIAKNASFFNSHRMMRRYVTEAYVR